VRVNASDQPEIAALKLQLAQLELQTQQSKEWEFALSVCSSSVATMSPIKAHVHGTLTEMGPDDGNVMFFFSALERFLE
jgi:hypothetical protein